MAGQDDNWGRVRGLARLMDEAVRIPGTPWRIGLDGLLGLVPGVGDAIGAGVSAYIVLVAMRHGAPTALVLRMVGVVLLDTLLGAIPLLGDIFDIGFKANQYNLRLLETHWADPQRSKRRSRVLVAAVTVGFVGGLVALVALAVWAVRGAASPGSG